MTEREFEVIKELLLADQSFIEAVAEAIWNMPVTGCKFPSCDTMFPPGWPDGIHGIAADTSSLPRDVMAESIAKMIEGNNQ